MSDSNKKPGSASLGKPAGRGPASLRQRKATDKARPDAQATPAPAPVNAEGGEAPVYRAPKKTAPAPQRLTKPSSKSSKRAVAKAAAKRAANKGVKRANKPEKSTVLTADGLTPAQRALAWTHTARFLTTASQLHQLPVNGVLPSSAHELDEDFEAEYDDEIEADDGAAPIESAGDAPFEGFRTDRQLPEIAFVGRSNAGKSTAINTLAQQKRLAFASKTPGRTQHINLFSLGPRDAADALFADLPGYGYAAVARDAKLRWQRVMADYLGQRESLSGVVLMVDSRLGLTDLDKQLLAFVSDRVTAGEVSLLVLLTKADKLNRKEGAEALAQVHKELGAMATEDSNIAVTLFSALNKQGLDDVAETLWDWAHPAEPEASDDSDEAEAEDEAEDDGSEV